MRRFYYILLFVVAGGFCFSAQKNSSNSSGNAAPVKSAVFSGFERGMGIGGWLTNYKREQLIKEKYKFLISVGDLEHFDTFISESDLANIASMGFDHVRLGFDQIVLEEKPYVYRESAMKHIEDFLKWAKKHNLNVVLNLHKAIGNYCDLPQEISLFDDAELQRRFVSLWLELERRFADYPNVAFELLNEVRNIDPQKWNNLADSTISALRKKNPSRKIIVGPVAWNSPNRLKDLKIWDDPNVIYTFHFYEPFIFTHQRGVLQPSVLVYNRVMNYPSDVEPYAQYFEFMGRKSPFAGQERIDKNTLKKLLQPAVDFAKRNPNKILWCGEFGTIRHAPLQSRENWMNDVISILVENDIPYCVWNYLSTTNDGNRFSLVDDDTRKIISPRLGQVLLQKKCQKN